MRLLITKWIISEWLFFEIIHKKRKTFRPDELLKRKWYSRDLSPERFKNSFDNEKDILVLLEED